MKVAALNPSLDYTLPDGQATRVQVVIFDHGHALGFRLAGRTADGEEKYTAVKLVPGERLALPFPCVLECG